ncbi:sensor histidine kinase [Vibrio salinus]|uniref:sensor histidine kinase n=1 Tax=Vibrio salinus TaxID=2899784 RepID=UPI001E3F5198|nr:hypothetical protein [Vibrio salinus]MCE0495530.1 hypothetical protein [Vibrio salinus]
MLKRIHYIIYSLILVALGFVVIAENIEPGVRLAIVILVFSGVCGGFLQGNAIRFSLSQRQLSSFKHEVQNILLSLSNRNDKGNEIKYGQFLRFKESILLFQIESKGVWHNKTFWNVKDLIQSTLDEYKEYAETVNVKLNYELNVTAPVSVSPEALNIALMILLSNAIGVTPRGASIEIKGGPSKDKSSYLIIISDGGSGIPRSVVNTFGKKVINRSSSLIDLHGMRRYGNGLNFLARLQKKVNFNIQLYADKNYSVAISIPTSNAISPNE